jgi:hypothetical protein
MAGVFGQAGNQVKDSAYAPVCLTLLYFFPLKNILIIRFSREHAPLILAWLEKILAYMKPVSMPRQSRNNRRNQKLGNNLDKELPFWWEDAECSEGGSLNPGEALSG